jgi:hypothetical protein
MHARLIVLTDKKNGSTSKNIRTYVYVNLVKQGFAGSTRFSYSSVDWFVIGGRWSGDFTKLYLDKNKLEEFEKEFDTKYGWFENREYDRNKRLSQAKELFKKYFPKFKDEIPYWRDNYNIYGYDDDAQIVNEKIWDEIKDLKNIDEDLNELYNGNGIVYLDKHTDTIKKKDIVNKTWAVIIDFHH